MRPPPATGAPLTFSCADGYLLKGHLWESSPSKKKPATPLVIIAGATGVTATYYHRYATFLAESGFTAVTFDYRGIGQSRASSLKTTKANWFDWGLKDIEAVLDWSVSHYGESDLHVVGHSFGGFSVGFAKHGRHVKRLLTVGAQHAYWRDYRRGHRLGLIWRWHVVMPVITLWNGYFPGKKMDWLEDLPRGVALHWARGSKEFVKGGDPSIRVAIRTHQISFTACTVAVAASDDPFATESAVARGLSYYPNSPAVTVLLKPEEFGRTEIGHFALFHSSFRETFWRDTVQWLRFGEIPWENRRHKDSR